ncbi:hypothetical protein I7I51_02123, partial [Histoplasma capsulatum]
MSQFSHRQVVIEFLFLLLKIAVQFGCIYFNSHLTPPSALQASTSTVLADLREMGINWNKDSIERFIGALLAAHPGFTPDYKTMAVHFGQGATYDSMKCRFREYRKFAQSMRQDNQELANSRTPIRRTTSSGRISKPSSAVKSGRMQTPLTPTKLSKMKTENGFDNPILIDEGLDCFVKHNSEASIPYEKNPGM